MKKKILITGSCGLIGSQATRFYHELGWEVWGIDNNHRKYFFGPEGDISFIKNELTCLKNYHHIDINISNRQLVEEQISSVVPEAIIHAAAQPSHDKAASIVFDDFFTNAVGTLNLLESARQHCPDSPFVFLSTNKVYGDNPNKLKIVEFDTRYEYSDQVYNFGGGGVDESMSVDNTTHSLFGASKLSADILVQEYGRYFGMKTCCLRCGCLTGEDHAGVKLHGFLNYLVKSALTGGKYEIIGYKGKQVRDNLHAIDVVSFISHFIKNPRSAEVYNLGGGWKNSCSVLEAIKLVDQINGKNTEIMINNNNRIGDHIVYYSDLSKCQKHYPEWTISKSLNDIVEGIVEKHLNTNK